MNYFYKLFYSALTTCKLTGWYATSFKGLEQNEDGIKDYGQHMDEMYLIKTSDPQLFYHLWNDL